MKNKRLTKILLLAGIGLFFFSISKASTKKKSMFSKFPKIAARLQLIYLALKDLGYSDEKINWMLAQILFETGQFTAKSKVAELNNNFSGIKWINKPYQIATKGTPVPPGERSNKDIPTNYYAKFASVKDWAKDYARILNIRYKPIQAPNLDQFLRRLALNNYFDARTEKSRNIYKKGVKYYLSQLA